MDAIREQFNKPLVVGVTGLVLGIILGLVWGWVVQPVEWTDAATRHLRADLQQDYLRLAIEDFERTQDTSRALARWAELEPAGEEALAAIKADQGNLSTQSIATYEFLVLGPPVAEEEAPSGNLLRTLLPVMCLLVVLLGVALGGVWFLRQRQVGGGERPMTSAEQSEYISQSMERTDYASTGQEPPIGQFMTTYMLGDDLFDDSFSIDSPAGEFLGECGVGIAEIIGLGDPKRVTAFEVWLFDKNDIQTVTKVLMSQHAYLDEEIRQRLTAKGEPVLAEPGAQFELTTATLRLVARVVDMAYGDGGVLPAESHFERVTLELAVWPA